MGLMRVEMSKVTLALCFETSALSSGLRQAEHLADIVGNESKEIGQCSAVAVSAQLPFDVVGDWH